MQLGDCVRVIVAVASADVVGFTGFAEFFLRVLGAPSPTTGSASHRACRRADARQLDDPELLVRLLIACGTFAFYNAEVPSGSANGPRVCRDGQGEPDQAERDVHDALTVAVRTQGYLCVPHALECLAQLAADDGNHPYAARLLGAAEGIRQRSGHVRFPMYQVGHDATVASVREALGQNDFDAAWAEGHALSIEEAIGYAQRGRGERKRPTSGWGSLTPMERDVVGLVREGLGNKEIGARLFISPRTVQTHLTHVYAKLGVTARVQLVQEAGRRSD